MLLEVVTLAGDVGVYFVAVCEPHARDFADCGVRFAGGDGRYLYAHPALKRRRVENGAVFERIKTLRHGGCFCFVYAASAAVADELGNT